MLRELVEQLHSLLLSLVYVLFDLVGLFSVNVILSIFALNGRLLLVYF
jgi:hypothetical protein